VEDRNWETISTDIIGQFSTTATYLPSKATEFGEKRSVLKATIENEMTFVTTHFKKLTTENNMFIVSVIV